jgi:hypothetical protein
MPTDACLWFYECEGCKVILRPLSGDCCVFCSYGTNKCPPIQAEPPPVARADVARPPLEGGAPRYRPFLRSMQTKGDPRVAF